MWQPCIINHKGCLPPRLLKAEGKRNLCCHTEMTRMQAISARMTCCCLHLACTCKVETVLATWCNS